MIARKTTSLIVAPFCLVLAATTSAEMTEHKRLLIRELLQLTAGAQSTQQITQIVLAQYQQVYGSMVDQLLSQASDLAPEQKQAVRGRLENFDWYAIQFSARFPERIDLEAIQEAVYVPLYDKHFDETELGELVSFYRTPTGRKTVELMPALVQEGMAATIPLIQPKVIALVSEIMRERLAQIR